MSAERQAAPPVMRFPPNPRGRDFVCGDIHGGWSLLHRELDKAGFDEARDRLFCVGDLIDRGRDSARFPEYLEAPWFQAVLGNHEQMALRAMLDGDRESEALWWINGGGWVMDLDPHQARDLVARLAELPLVVELEGYGEAPVVIAHAALPGNDWPGFRDRREMLAPDPRETGEPLHTLLWDRSRLGRGDDSVIAGARHVFHGHTVIDQVRSLGNRTYLDTGSVMTGRLTVLDIGDWLAGREETANGD